MSRRGVVKQYLRAGKGGQVSSLTRRGWTVEPGGDPYQVKATSPTGKVFRFWPGSEYWQLTGPGALQNHGKDLMIQEGEKP